MQDQEHIIMPMHYGYTMEWKIDLKFIYYPIL